MKQFASFKLDTANECLWQGDKQISLPPKPFALLRYLVENPGRLITHDELLESLWPETYVQPQVLRTYMLDLRKVLGDDAGHPQFIQTLPKRGYCFVATVADCATTRATAVAQARPAGIVGRDEELASLAAHAVALVEGQRQVVFITGEAGIGKTALADAFCSQAGLSMPVSVARGQCVEGFAAKEEYYPVMEALGQLCASPDGETACRVLARVAPAWLGTSRREKDAATVANEHPAARERLPGNLCEALEQLAAEKPLVLMFEDLNWADDATLHLISALARRLAPARLMVVATYRPHAGATDNTLEGLKQDLLRRHLCTEMALAPLAKPAVRALLSRELKQEELPPGLTGFVHEHSEGNPLFAIAILEHLITQRFLVCDKTGDVTRWRQQAAFEEMEAGVPDGLAQMIELEIARLTPVEQRLLEAGSLINVAFPAWAVAAALEEDVAETEEACDDLARSVHFLERAGEDELPDGTCSAFYVFAHGLYREVLFQRQSSTRRARRHVRIAERLALLFAGREADVAREMAFHYEAAGSWQDATAALRAAARHARQRQAHAEATELLERALRIAGKMNEHGSSTAAQEIHAELLGVRGSAD